MGSLKSLDGLLQEVLKRGPGGAGLRVYQGEDLLYENYVGYASKEKNIPFTDKTICQLASMTKPIASAACMQLFEQGKFLLTDFVEDYYPEWKDHKIYTYSPRGDLRVEPAKVKPTVGHLFDMTSGVTVDWVQIRCVSMERMSALRIQSSQAACLPICTSVTAEV